MLYILLLAHITFYIPTQSEFQHLVSVVLYPFCNMSVLLFPDQITDCRQDIRRVHNVRQRTVLVKSFLEKAYFALRDEVWNLHRDVRDQIPPFNSVFDLSERHAASKIQRLEVSSALLCISFLAQLIGYVQPNILYD